MSTKLLAIDLRDNFGPANTFNDYSKVINLIVSNLFLLAGLILFIGIIVGGFNMMMGGSNPETLKKGQKTLTYSLIGFILILLSYFIVKVILQLLGVPSIL